MKRAARLAALVLFSLMLLWPTGVWAGLFLYAGAGTADQFPGTIRFGYGNWEGGFLTTGSFGADKIFRMNNNFYGAFGPVLTMGNPTSFGFYGAFGVECNLFWGFTFRGEMNAVGGASGFARGELNAGLGLHF